MVAVVWAVVVWTPIGVRTGNLGALWMPAAIATSSMVGSLYYSESLGYLPCELCWYQRIGMYSLAIMLVIAAIRKDRNIALYALVLAAVGLGVAAFHYGLQIMPGEESCSLDAPCSIRWVNVFGWYTMPLMAASGFLAIGSSMLAVVMRRFES